MTETTAPTVTTGPLRALFTRAVTIEYDWENPSAPVVSRGGGKTARVTRIVVTYGWNRETGSWNFGRVQASGSRIRKDGTPWLVAGEHPERLPLLLPAGRALTIENEHRPRTVIDWTELDADRD